VLIRCCGNVFSEPLSSNGRLCGASLTAHFRCSGVMSQYTTFRAFWTRSRDIINFVRCILHVLHILFCLNEFLFEGTKFYPGYRNRVRCVDLDISSLCCHSPQCPVGCFQHLFILVLRAVTHQQQVFLCSDEFNRLFVYLHASDARLMEAVDENYLTSSWVLMRSSTRTSLWFSFSYIIKNFFRNCDSAYAFPICFLCK
jgi:hypothetical protein